MTTFAEPRGEPAGSYVEHFDFREPPFLSSPNPRFAHGTESQARALEAVTSGVNSREGLILVTGEDGTGKTTLCLALAHQFGRRTFVSVILNPPLTAEDLLRQLLVDFGVVASDRGGDRAAGVSNRSDQHLALQGFLVSLGPVHGHAVVVIDEAQQMSPDALQEILRLTNFEVNHPGLLQIILVGRPNLEEVLRQPDVRGVGQRMSRLHSLPPLTGNEVSQYIERRLWVARGGIAAHPASKGSNGARNRPPCPRFTRAAVGVIADRSSGNPRVINVICDRALTLARDRETDRISGRLARRAAADLGLRSEVRYSWRPTPKVAAAIVVTFAAGALLAASLLNGGRTETPAGIKPAPEASLSSDQPFQAFRKQTLQRATSLATEPNVKGLLKLQDDVHLWDDQTKNTSHVGVEGLLIELERLTNEARQRQLERDREMILEDSNKPTSGR